VRFQASKAFRFVELFHLATNGVDASTLTASARLACNVSIRPPLAPGRCKLQYAPIGLVRVASLTPLTVYLAVDRCVSSYFVYINHMVMLKIDVSRAI
jgi:hypothetical protein